MEPATFNNLHPYQQRVVLEHEELSAAIKRLDIFLEGQAFRAIGKAEQGRLTLQRQAMGLYAAILQQRIDAFVPAINSNQHP